MKCSHRIDTRTTSHESVLGYRRNPFAFFFFPGIPDFVLMRQEICNHDVDEVFWELIFILPFFFPETKFHTVVFSVFKNSNFLLILALLIAILVEKQGYYLFL